MVREGSATLADLGNAPATARRIRHIRTLGQVGSRVIDAAADAWRAERIDGPLDAMDSVLLLVDQNRTSPTRYLEALQALDRNGSPLGVLPVAGGGPGTRELVRLLGEDEMKIELSRSRFRASVCPEANLPGAPPVLRRAAREDPASVAEDLTTPDLLFLQGHSGPVDGGFGRWLVLCSRHLHTPGEPRTFPCFGTDRCFRQESLGRPATSADGLQDPRELRSALLVIDGCNSLLVPGALFGYGASLARSVMSSGVRAAVMTHGVSATPLSAVLVFLASLARGRRLGEAVREANRHQHELGSPASIPGQAAAPWVLLGNPEVRVQGLECPEVAPRRSGSGFEVTLRDHDIPRQTGTVLYLQGVTPADGPLDVRCADGRWARGALHDGKGAYLWVSGARGGAADGDEASSQEVSIELVPRPRDATLEWRRRALWHPPMRGWLLRLAEKVVLRGGSDTEIRRLVSLRDELAESVEQVVFATAPQRSRTIAPPLASATGALERALEDADRETARTVAGAMADAAARSTHLWSPPWLDDGEVPIDEPCACGCVIVGHAWRHAVLDLARVQLSCPACSLLGDVSALAPEGTDMPRVLPAILGRPLERQVLRGGAIPWTVRRLDRGPAAGFACAALYDAFREQSQVTEVVQVSPASTATLSLPIGGDWPEGLARGVLVLASAGEISCLELDAVVHAG